MGGATSITANCPIRIATENTVWAMPDLERGYFLDVGASYFLPRIKNNPALGLYLALTSHKLKGPETVTWGVATHFAESRKMDKLRKNLRRSSMLKSPHPDWTAEKQVE